MSINTENQANLVVDKRLKPGEYVIACNNCGKSIHGPVSGDRIEAAIKLMELSVNGCPNKCKNSSLIIQIHPVERENKYTDKNPYPPKDLIK